MAKHKLDDIDRKIIRELQQDGRITNVELARRVDISAPPCLRRVRALEEMGVIKGYHADLEPHALGYDVMVFVMVGLEGQSEADLKEFEKQVNEWPMVRECYMLNGEFDFFLKVVAPDLASFQEFLTANLTSAPHVDTVRTSLNIRATKHLPGVPVLED